MKANKPPAFQFYPKDWDDFKVQRMSYEAQGVYMKILCFMWKDSEDQCSILDDNNSIAKSLGLSKKKWMAMRKIIQYEGDPLLVEKNGKLFSKKLQKISKKIKEYRKSQAKKAKEAWKTRGAKPKASHKLAKGKPMPEGMPKVCSSSSSSSSNNKPKGLYKNTQKGELEKLFGEFWEVYPRKEEKKDALLAFKALLKKESIETIAKATNGYNDYLKKDRLDRGISIKEQMRYIKLPASFLRKDKWKTHIDYVYKPKL